MFHNEENKEQMVQIERSLLNLEKIVQSKLRGNCERRIWFEFERKQEGRTIVIFTLIYKRPQTESQIYGLIKSRLTRTQPSPDLLVQKSHEIGEIRLEYEAENVTNLILSTGIFINREEASMYLLELLPILEEIACEAAVPKQPKPTVPTTLTLPQVGELSKLISKWFSKGELRNLSLYLLLDYENLPSDTKNDMARELVNQARRENKVPRLWAKLYKERPHVDWSQAMVE